jgi:hypothetical protein
MSLTTLLIRCNVGGLVMTPMGAHLMMSGCGVYRREEKAIMLSEPLSWAKGWSTGSACGKSTF